MRKLAKVAIITTSLFAISFSGMSGTALASEVQHNEMYTVQSGDTLSLIAERAGITLDDILWYNAVNNPDNIFIGQRFFIPAPWLVQADQIMLEGKKYLGTTYAYGAASGQTDTFDCSSFTQYIYGAEGLSLPRDSREQSQVGQYIAREQLQKGDLVFFSTPDRQYKTGIEKIGHVAMYIGNDQLLHTFNENGVQITGLESNRYWKDRYLTARRVLD